MSLVQTAPRLTEAEYLAIERAAEFKSEFFEGEMFAMAGGKPQHSLVGSNLVREVGNRLGGTGCVTYNSDLRIKIEATRLYTYPDVSVICGELQFANETDDTVINPSVLVDVLSDSTEAYDRGKKFEHYQQIGTLREYLLVSQKGPRIEQFVRQTDGRWLWTAASGLAAMLELPTLGISIALSEVFANVKFPPAELREVSPRRKI
jgi:Uma2 family endonuclease